MSATQETLELLKTAQSSPDDIIKSFIQPATATTGFQAYNLQAPSLKLYPVLTPLRNSIPRDSGGYAIQANWKAVTNINVGNTRAGVSEGKRGGAVNNQLIEVFAAFRGYGLENNVTFEANYAAKNFEDVKALAVQQTLESLMVQEERLILGGNTSVDLGTTNTPTLTSGAGVVASAFTNVEYDVQCIALGLQAYLDTVGVNNGSIGSYFDAATSTVEGMITRTNTDGTTDTFGGGSAAPSLVASITPVAGDEIVASVVPTVGAVGYAWFIGLGGADAQLVAVSSLNSVVLTAPAPAAAQHISDVVQPLSGNASTSALDFDGLLYQAFKPSSNAYVKVLDSGVAGVGTGLTADGAGGIVEFEEAFVQFYNKYRLSPTVIYVSSQELINITRKIIGNNGAPLLRLTTDAANPSSVQAGLVVGEYLNKVTGTKVAMRVHPNLPAGTVFFFTEKLPYPMSNVSTVAKMLMRQDYYQLEWPLKTRRYEYGVYADGVLQHYAPFSMGIITNIANI